MRYAARPKYCRISIYLASIEGYHVRNASSLEIPSKRLRNHFLVNGVSLVTVIIDQIQTIPWIYETGASSLKASS